jgi:hypothetical protein
MRQQTAPTEVSDDDNEEASRLADDSIIGKADPSADETSLAIVDNNNHVESMILSPILVLYSRNFTGFAGDEFGNTNMYPDDDPGRFGLHSLLVLILNFISEFVKLQVAITHVFNEQIEPRFATLLDRAVSTHSPECMDTMKTVILRFLMAFVDSRMFLEVVYPDEGYNVNSQGMMKHFFL